MYNIISGLTYTIYYFNFLGSEHSLAVSLAFRVLHKATIKALAMFWVM